DISSGGCRPSNEAACTPDYNVQQSKVISQQSAVCSESDLRVHKAPAERLQIKIKYVEEFFLDNPDLEYQSAGPHSLDQSPCYPIIDSKAEADVVWYNCKLHPDFVNINLSSIEHHCKYFKPALHKTEIL